MDFLFSSTRAHYVITDATRIAAWKKRTSGKSVWPLRNLRPKAGWALLPYVLYYLALVSSPCIADDTHTATFSGFIDTNFAHDFNQPPTRYRSYTTQPYYTDEPALNLGYIDATVHSTRYRGRLALQYGSSVIANYATEPEIAARYFQEAYGGLQLSESLSVDVGVFLSHIGFESWISRDNFTASRSLVADYSPYYQSGVRSTYTFSSSLQGTLYLLRGWQNISGDRDPALGTQLSYKTNDSTTLIHNIFIGNEHGTRTLNNFIIKQGVTNDLNLVASYDIGTQARRNDSTALWNGFSVVSQYRLNKELAAAFRVERYSDPHNAIVKTPFGRAFNTTSLSANIDYAITQALVWRTEYRAFIATQDIFPRHEALSPTDSFVMVSVLYTFSAPQR